MIECWVESSHKMECLTETFPWHRRGCLTETFPWHRMECLIEKRWHLLASHQNHRVKTSRVHAGALVVFVADN